MSTRKSTSAGSLMADAAAGLDMRRRKRTLQADSSTLAKAPLFAGLPKRHQRRLAQLMDQVNYASGRVIVEAGLPGRAFFVIAAGRVKVYAGKVTSGRALARLGPGQFFGEMAMLDGGPRSATVVADGPVTALRLTRSNFLRMISQEPTVAVAIMAGLAERLRKGAPTE
jgi:CRP/FNR family transcriptional regulator, cyclic AMP receptor protein